MPPRMGKFLATGAGFFIAFVYIRNGTATKLVSDGARGVNDGLNGIKSVVRLG